jgi:hypothetical protein
MPGEEKIPIPERFEYLSRAQKQYLRSTRREQTRLLDRMEHITRHDRNVCHGSLATRQCMAQMSYQE